MLVAGGLFAYASTLTTQSNVTLAEAAILIAKLENQASHKLGRGDVVSIPEHPTVIKKRWTLATYIVGGAGLFFVAIGWAVRGASIAGDGKAQ